MTDRLRTDARISVRRANSTHTDAATAVAELAEQVDTSGFSVLLFFCSPSYDLGVLAEQITSTFDGPVVGCTTAGEIVSGSGYLEGGIVGVSITSQEVIAHPRLVSSLDHVDASSSAELIRDVEQNLRLSDGLDPASMFGLLLVDGTSMLEEQVVASLYANMNGVSIIGGSAGDGLDFGTTYVYLDGAFHTDAAVLTLFETTLPFETFRVQHFEPTDTRMVITEADPPRRIVTEINGEPAAQEYARAVGLEVEELSPQVFAAYPVMLRINGEYFVRSIQKVNDDGSLTFFCAIDNGLVLTVAQGANLLEHLEKNLDELAERVPGLQLLLGCDCILRRLELVQRDIIDQAAPVLERFNFVGFSTYGEQYDGIHVNQTLTGLALGS